MLHSAMKSMKNDVALPCTRDGHLPLASIVSFTDCDLVQIAEEFRACIMDVSPDRFIKCIGESLVPCSQPLHDTG
jgi:hypothetical protein